MPSSDANWRLSSQLLPCWLSQWLEETALLAEFWLGFYCGPLVDFHFYLLLRVTDRADAPRSTLRVVEDWCFDLALKVTSLPVPSFLYS